MPIGISLLLVAFFIAMNAFFVIAEFAMVRVRPSQIEMAVQEKKPGAKAAKRVTSDVNAYLAACQLGITLIVSSNGDNVGKQASHDYLMWIAGRAQLACNNSIAVSKKLFFYSLYHVVF